MKQNSCEGRIEDFFLERVALFWWATNPSFFPDFHKLWCIFLLTWEMATHLEHAFQVKKYQSQNSIQHFEFSRPFLALIGLPFCRQTAIAQLPVRENSKCCIEFWLWDFFSWNPCSNNSNKCNEDLLSWRQIHWPRKRMASCQGKLALQTYFHTSQS